MNISTEVESIHRQFDWSVTPPSHAVVEAVAALENVDPIRLPETFDISLSDHIDPEALDRLVPGDSRIELSFTCKAYAVHISGNMLHVSHRR